MKHLTTLNNKELAKITTGEYFTYCKGSRYRKGLKIALGMMIPIGLLCRTIARAQKQL